MTTHPISLVGRQDGACVLMRYLEPPRRRWWREVDGPGGIGRALAVLAGDGPMAGGDPASPTA